MIQIRVSPAELLDRLSILELKLKACQDPARSEVLDREAQHLRAAWDDSVYSLRLSNEVSRLWRELREVNARGWDIENQVRVMAVTHPGFPEVAAEAYANNDRRSRLKLAIDAELDSPSTEHKERT